VLTFPLGRDGETKDETDARPIEVGSTAWWAWLARDTSTRFCFESGLLRFVARRRRRNGAWRWYASSQQFEGRHHEVVLGTAAALTLERLERVAQTLELIGLGEASGAGVAPTRAARTRQHAGGRRPSAPLSVPSVTLADQSGLAADPMAADPMAADPMAVRGTNNPDPSLQPVPVLATKLFIPHPRTDLVPRPRLLAQLETGLRGPVTLLAAPAGWGKTSLLSVCCAAVAAAAARDTGEGSRRLVAWLSLDAGDNDPIRFWTYVLTALNTACAGVGAVALAQVRSPQPPPIDLVLTLLLNDLAAQQADVILVLDDYHVIEAEPVHAAIMFLLNHLPPRCHLVLSSREDPPLTLSRLRTQGAVTELRAADLRFTPEETAAFLTAALGVDAPLTMEAIRILDTRGEGWIAGLQLAALSLRGQSRQQAEAFIAAFAGSNRYLVDYFVEEVLARQPPAIQIFLLRTAVVDRFCVPLCERLLDGKGPATASMDATTPGLSTPAHVQGLATTRGILERVERANLFLIPLDDERRWYRYHHLFADALRSRLRDDDPGLYTELHKRASAWFGAEGLFEEAVDHALASTDFERAAALVEQHGLGLGVAGQVETVLDWIRALPGAVVRTHPQLCACHVVILFLSGQVEAALEPPLHDLEAAVVARRQAGAEEAQLRPLLGILATTQGLVAIPPGDLRRSVALAHEAFFESLPETYATWRLLALIMLQQSFIVTGAVTRASIREWSQRAATFRTQGPFNLFMALDMDLAHRQHLHGQLRAAAAAYEEAIALIPAPLRLEDLVGGAACAFGLADVRLERNDLASADQLLTRGMPMLQRWMSPAGTATLGYVAQARLQQARGEYAAALATLDDFAALAERRRFAAVWPARAAAVRAQIQIAQGDLAGAIRWATASGLSSEDPELEFLREREYLTLVRVRIAQCQGRSDPSGPHLDEALRLLDRVQHDAEPKERLSSVLEVLILRALAFHARRDRRGAVRTLARALEMAQPEGYVRLFADEGAPMAALLASLLAAAHQRHVAMPATLLDYAQFLLAVCRAHDGGIALPETIPVGARAGEGPPPSSSPSVAPGVPPLLDPLTKRELEVLRMLTEGSSNAAIATALVVEVGTAKKHVYNACRKLGAQNRTQAVARARALRLL
jgi:LuxR family maltose regulon positive regulatory protein